MRSDAQEQILAYLRQDAPIEVPDDAEPIQDLAYAEPTRVSLGPIKPKPEPPKVGADDASFDARFIVSAE